MDFGGECRPPSLQTRRFPRHRAHGELRRWLAMLHCQLPFAHAGSATGTGTLHLRHLARLGLMLWAGTGKKKKKRRQKKSSGKVPCLRSKGGREPDIHVLAGLLVALVPFV